MEFQDFAGAAPTDSEADILRIEKASQAVTEALKHYRGAVRQLGYAIKERNAKTPGS